MQPTGRYYRILRAIVKPFFFLRHVDSVSGLDTPCILLCRHRNMRGPFATILHYADSASPWIYYPFCEKKTFFDQFYGYTLTTRLHWPKPLAYPAARLLSALVPPLIRSFGGIPVYRKESNLRTTFRLSLNALLSGRSIMIYPDIDYTSNNGIGNIYEGFFLLERLYFQKTKRHLPFVPVHLDTHAHTMQFDTPVIFGDGPYAEEKAAALEKILQAWRSRD